MICLKIRLLSLSDTFAPGFFSLLGDNGAGRIACPFGSAIVTQYGQLSGMKHNTWRVLQVRTATIDFYSQTLIEELMRGGSSEKLHKSRSDAFPPRRTELFHITLQELL